MDDSVNTMNLMNLPPELCHEILGSLDPIDFARFSQTCHAAYSYSQAAAVWRKLFRNQWDQVQLSPEQGAGFDHKLAVQHRTAAAINLLATKRLGRSIVYDPNHDCPDLETLTVAVQVAETRRPRLSMIGADGYWLDNDDDDDDQVSLNEQWLIKYGSHPIKVLPFSPHRNPFKPWLALRPWLESTTDADCKISPAQLDQINMLAKFRALRTPPRSTTLAILTAARENVYEAAHCKRSTRWGPFLDGRDEPDWKKLEALGIVMSAGLEEAMTYGWGNDTTLPRGWKATRPGPTLVNGKNPRDWAGVEDTEFRGTYQFLDFNSFLHYNHHRTRDTKPDLENEDEATGDCMRLMLKLLPPGQLPVPPDARPGAIFNNDDSDDSDDYDDDDDASFTNTSEDDVSLIDSDDNEQSSEPSPPTSIPSNAEDQEDESAKPATDGTQFPALNFVGTSEPLHFHGTFASFAPHLRQPDRSIRGTVRMTKSGHVHWRYIIRYGGVDHWLLNGIQIGGPRSRYGVLGYWSTADHDEGGPHGPFAYWPHIPKPEES